MPAEVAHVAMSGETTICKHLFVHHWFHVIGGTHQCQNMFSNEGLHRSMDHNGSMSKPFFVNGSMSKPFFVACPWMPAWAGSVGWLQVLELQIGLPDSLVAAAAATGLPRDGTNMPKSN